METMSRHILMKIYDPNETGSHRNVIIKDKESANNLRLDYILSDDAISSYFEKERSALLSIYKDPNNLPEKIGINSIDFSNFGNSNFPEDNIAIMLSEGTVDTGTEISKAIIESNLSIKTKAVFLANVLEFSFLNGPEEIAGKTSNYIFDNYLNNTKISNEEKNIFLQNSFPKIIALTLPTRENRKIIFNFLKNTDITKEQKNTILANSIDQVIYSAMSDKDANAATLVINALNSSDIAEEQKNTILASSIRQEIYSAASNKEIDTEKLIINELNHSDITKEHKNTTLGLVSEIGI